MRQEYTKGKLESWRSCCLPSHLLQLLHHLLDARISSVAHLLLHLGQPLTELFVFVVEDGPGTEAVCDFLPAQGHLGSFDKGCCKPMK